jgi:CheY-like chemotaxis protein
MLKNKSILLLEDNPDYVALANRAFKAKNINNGILVRTDGEAALDLFFGTQAFNWDNHSLLALVLLDLKLQKINGLDVLQRLRSDQRTKLIPVIILTSSNEKSDVTSGYRSGCNSYIRKPVDFNQFKEMIKETCIYCLNINEAPCLLQ